MFAVAATLLLGLSLVALALRRSLKRRKLNALMAETDRALGLQIMQICNYAQLTGRTMIIHRGIPGYCVMVVYADYPARLAERKLSARTGTPYASISSAVQFWIGDKFYLIGLGKKEITFHVMQRNDIHANSDLMPVTRDARDIRVATSALQAFYDYLDLPGALYVAREPKAATEPTQAIAPSSTDWQRPHKVSRGAKMEHLAEYIACGDHQTFFEMFDSDDGHDIILWVDHREDDADIPKMCEHILQTGMLDGHWGGDEGTELIITFQAREYLVRYPNDFADRDTSIKALSAILRPNFELRYCTASNGCDAAALLPLTPKQWDDLEVRFGEKLKILFEKVDEEFSKFGR